MGGGSRPGGLAKKNARKRTDPDVFESHPEKIDEPLSFVKDLFK
jgi:hypothetical protein